MDFTAGTLLDQMQPPLAPQGHLNHPTSEGLV